MSEKIEFEVGHKYKNMKGVYEVISINDDSMIIRWKNGEQVSSPIDLQRRIIQRMQREKQERDNEKKQNQPKEPKKKAKKSTPKGPKSKAGKSTSKGPKGKTGKSASKGPKGKKVK